MPFLASLHQHSGRVPVFVVLGFIALLIIGACTDTDPGFNTRKVISGVVMDEAISGAVVNLVDANGTSYGTATSASDGSYALSVPTGQDISQLHVQASVGTDASMNGIKVTEAFVLMAPASKPEVVSPLTTLISQQVLSGNDLTTAEAKALTYLPSTIDGKTLAVSDLYKNYIASNAATHQAWAKKITEYIAKAQTKSSNLNLVDAPAEGLSTNDKKYSALSAAFNAIKAQRKKALDNWTTADTAIASVKAANSARIGELTLNNCTTNISESVPLFFRTYFHCVKIYPDTADKTITIIETKGLPPYRSYYYGNGHVNYADFDVRDQLSYQPSSYVLAAKSFRLRFKAEPEARGSTDTPMIEASLITGSTDGVAQKYTTKSPIGMALNGVALMAPLVNNNPPVAGALTVADLLTQRDYFEGLVTSTNRYHYLTYSRGPLEVLYHKGLVTTSTPSKAEVEVYGLLCDGTVVLGQTEPTGLKVIKTGQTDNAVVYPALDAQGGHSHVLKDKDGNNLFNTSARYHVHLGPDLVIDKLPEIQYYAKCADAEAL